MTTVVIVVMTIDCFREKLKYKYSNMEKLLDCFTRENVCNDTKTYDDKHTILSGLVIFIF